MLRVIGDRYRLCDELTRRDVLKVGALGLGGLTLSQLLRAEAAAGIRNSHKSIIMVYMVGAPPHQDMYDLKLEAPAEIRGEFRPIPTNVPGIDICEHMPYMAKIMDRCIPLRSVYGSPNGSHDSFICYTGRSFVNQPPGGWPAIGPVVSKVRGPADPAVPPFIGLAPDAGHPPYGSPGLPGFLGVGHAAFRSSGPAQADMVLNTISPDRLQQRGSLLQSFDRLRRDIDARGTLQGIDDINAQVLGIDPETKLHDLAGRPQYLLDRREPVRELI